jgi:transposase-like protein
MDCHRLQGAHFSKEVMLMSVRWYLACPLSVRHVEELAEEMAQAL